MNMKKDPVKEWDDIKMYSKLKKNEKETAIILSWESVADHE